MTRVSVRSARLKLDSYIYERHSALKAGLGLSESGSRRSKSTTLYRAACGGVLGINTDAEISIFSLICPAPKTLNKVLLAMPLSTISNSSRVKSFNRGTEGCHRQATKPNKSRKHAFKDRLDALEIGQSFI
jgi:hypothetical protein